MTDKHRRPGLVRSVLHFVMIIPTLFSFVSNLVSMVSLEARIAGRNIIKIIIFSIIMLSVLTVTWLCVLALLVVYLVENAHLTLLISVAIALAVNIVVLAIIGVLINKFKNEISFENTQHFLSHLNPTHED